MLEEQLGPSEHALVNTGASLKRAVTISVPKHFSTHHKQSTAGLRVWVMKSIPGSFFAPERYKHLCQQETFWIYSLGTLSPGGVE